MAEQVGKFLTELPELETPTDGDLMYIVDDETTSKKVTMANLKRVLGGNVTGTVEGASVSFSDGADGIPMEECEVTIVPTQDLHGYSKPWAGGAGKNKFPQFSGTHRGVTFTPQDDGTIKINGELTTSGWALVQHDYTLSELGLSIGNSIAVFNDNTTQAIVRFLDSSSTQISQITSGNSGDIPSGTVTIRLIMNATTIQPSQGDVINEYGKFMIVIGTTVPTTFEPYSNICPISGHTDVTVTVASTSGGSGEDYTVSLGSTYYGGTLGVTTGELEVTWENIASYAGETLPGEWLSSLDEYTALGTPTTGAQVVYELATPQTFNLTKEQIQTLLGQNYVSHDGGGNIKVVYIRDLDITINDLIDRVTALENE